MLNVNVVIIQFLLGYNQYIVTNNDWTLGQ